MLQFAEIASWEFEAKSANLVVTSKDSLQICYRRAAIGSAMPIAALGAGDFQ